MVLLGVVLHSPSSTASLPEVVLHSPSSTATLPEVAAQHHAQLPLALHNVLRSANPIPMLPSQLTFGDLNLHKQGTRAGTEPAVC